MREPTTITAEQADEVVSIVQSVDIENLSPDDMITVLYAWEYISRTLDIPPVSYTHLTLPTNREV